MTPDESITSLNTLSVPTAEETRPLNMDELRELFKNPPQRPRSIPMQDAMANIVGAFRNADENARHAIALALTKHARRKFLGFAADQAVLAVRQNLPDLIEQGLVALAIENGGNDWRDSLIVLFQLHHSAGKIGMDAAATFAKIALLAEPGVIKKEMLRFPLRPPESRSLKAFCLSEEETEEGFRYKQIPWSTQAPPAPARPIETPQQISARLTPDQQKALIGMAGTLAEMAIRTKSPKLVEQGLQGLAMGGGALPASHSMEALAKLYDAAQHFELDALKVFAEAANLAPEGELKREMVRFPLQK